MDDITDMIHEDRLHDEFCGFCLTRHHPNSDCQETT